MMQESTTSAASVPRVVLVHGAFADGSSWHKVIPRLRARGVDVVAVQNPLTSLADDVAFARRAIDAQPGPVVLVGHSWAGTVITVAGEHDQVKALVYVAAFAPDVGESSIDQGKPFPPPPGREGRLETADGYQRLTTASMRANFAPDLDPAEADVLAVTQGWIRKANFEETVAAAAWKSRPSWYVLARDDRMVHPDAQRAAATRIGATLTEVDSSHVPMLSRPDAVAAAILSAVDAVAAAQSR